MTDIVISAYARAHGVSTDLEIAAMEAEIFQESGKLPFIDWLQAVAVKQTLELAKGQTDFHDVEQWLLNRYPEEKS